MSEDKINDKIQKSDELVNEESVIPQENSNKSSEPASEQSKE